MSNSSLPYFERILDHMEREDPALAETLNGNMHWGYWEDERNIDLSDAGLRAAAGALNLEVFRELDIRDGMSLVDIGCGIGGAIAALDERHSGLEMTGINIDPRQIATAQAVHKAKSSPKNRVKFVVADACVLPCADQSMDRAFAIECIFHFSSRLRFLRETFRVLKPGGLLAITDFVVVPALIPLMLAIYPFYYRAVRQTYGPSIRLTTLGLYKMMARLSGMELVSVRDITKQTLPTYAALQAMAPRFGDLASDFRRANRFAEICARNGSQKYSLIVFRRP